MQRAQGFAQQGGEVVWTAGVPSTTLVQESFPFALITVFISGTTLLAQLYSDNQTFPTPMSNPFVANEDGYWWFYAANGRYDVMIASPGLAVPWTIGDILLNDGGGAVGSQTPWLSNIDGGGFNLTNVGFIDVTGGYLINGVPLSNPNLWVPVPNSSSIYHQGFVGVINQNPAFALDVQGGCNVTDNFYINGVAITAGSGGGGPWVVLGPTQINYPGNVGISNTNPQYALDVHGSINVSTGNNFFINGVALASSGQNPWTILPGNRITYAGQVGVGQASPAYPLDVLGDMNITGAYRVNGQPIAGGGGQWISGGSGVLYYNGGNVGIGTQTPTVPLQVTGAAAVGSLAMSGNPTAPVINSSGAFVGAGVNVGSFGLAAATVNVTGQGQQPNATVLTVHGDITCSESIDCAGQVIGAAYAINGTEASPPNSGGFVINGNGAFVGSGVDVTGQTPVAGPSGGIRCIDLQANSVSVLGPIQGIQTAGEEGALLALGAVVSADASSATTGGPAVTGGYYVQPLNGTPIQCISSTGIYTGQGVQTQSDVFSGLFGIVAGGAAGAPTNMTGASGTFTDGSASITIWGGIITAFTSGSGGGGGGGTGTFATITVNGNINMNQGGQMYVNGVEVISSAGIFGGNGLQSTGAVYGSGFGITGQSLGVSGSFTTLTGYTVTVLGGLVTGIASGGGGGSATITSLTVNGNINMNNGGQFYAGGVECISSAGIFGGNGVQTNSDIFGGLFGITGQATGTSGSFTTLNGASVQVLGGIVTSIAGGGTPSPTFGTVTASQFNVAGGNPGVSANIAWYGASTSGGPANVLHQIVIENGIVVALS